MAQNYYTAEVCSTYKLQSFDVAMTVNLSSFKLRLQRVQELLGKQMDTVSFNLTAACIRPILDQNKRQEGNGMGRALPFFPPWLRTGGIVSCSFADKKHWGFTILLLLQAAFHHTDEIVALYDRKVPIDLFAALHQMDNIKQQTSI